MKFRARDHEEPEINLIPFIDVLLVVLIFLMLSTTYSKFTELQLRLPVADTETLREHPQELLVTVTREGRYALNRQPVTGQSAEALSMALAEAAKAGKDTVLVISADAATPHQAVVTVMEAARRAGLSQLSFAAQSTASASP